MSTTILITGGTGLIGRALTAGFLDKGCQIIILTRNPEICPSSDGRTRYAAWNVEQQTIDNSAIADADHIIHLAGAGISEKRWTKKRKEEIVNSRVQSANLLFESLRKIPNRVQSVISASAIGWYGEDGPAIKGRHEEFEETDPVDDGFLGQTCRQWEESVHQMSELGKRIVIFRTGIVLSRHGGALLEFLKPLRYGLATILGSGKQIISWIHIRDLIRLYVLAVEDDKFRGVFNAVSPDPVSNKEFILELARLKRKRNFIPIHVPSLALKLVLGEMSVEVLKSCTVSCSKVHFEGFVFQFPSLKAALLEVTDLPAAGHPR